MASKKTVTVHEVLYDAAGREGPAADGTITKRFRGKDREAAVAFASRVSCYGREASVVTAEVPAAVARRWGVL